MARIPKETVDQIIHTADILEVVGDYVSLKRNGQNYWACCPFHNEKSPSFSVTPAKGFYKCFGCGKSGNVVGFVMDIEGSSYPEALRQLAKKYGVEIPAEEERTPEEQLRQNERDSQYIVSDWAKSHYHRLLQNTEEGMGVGYAYLKERGLNLNTIQTFELGYSLDQWDDLLKSAEKAGHQLKYLEKTGLVVKREDDQGHDTGRRYDRFRGRVMFPIHNVSGRVVGFGARTLKRDDKMAKYLNSPESDIYHKSDVLYGLFHARQPIRQEEQCFLVEGYLDVLSLHQGGIKNVVASSGTSLTEGQIRLIKRYTDNVTVLYDGDAAGIKASLRGIDLLLEGGLNVRVVLFPDGDDPDSYIRKVGDQRFATYIENQSQDFIAFKTTLVAREANTDPVKKAEAIREVLQSIAKVPDGLKRQVFLQQTASVFGFDEQVIITEYNKLLKIDSSAKARSSEIKEANINAVQASTPTQTFSPQEEAEMAMYGISSGSEAEFRAEPKPTVDADLAVLQDCEYGVLRLLMLYGPYEISEGQSVAYFLLDQLDGIEFSSPIYSKIWSECYRAIANGQALDARQFMYHPDSEVRSLIADFATDTVEPSANWRIKDIYIPSEANMILPLCENAVMRLNLCHAERELKRIDKILRTPNLSNEEADNVLIAQIQTKKVVVELGKRLGNVVPRSMQF